MTRPHGLNLHMCDLHVRESNFEFDPLFGLLAFLDI